MTEQLIANDDQTRRVEELEAFIGAGDWNAAAEFVTSDISYHVGHRAPAIGIAGIKDYMSWQNRLVHWDGHDTLMKFSRGHKAVFEVQSHFTRIADGAKIRVPCTDIYTFKGDLISEWRVYADTSVFVV